MNLPRVALYLQDRHSLQDGIKYAQYAEAKGFEAVWQAESRLVRIDDHGKAHFDIEFAPRFVQGARQRRAAVQPCRAACHGGVEAAPVCRPQVFGDDQVEALPVGFGERMAEHRRGGAVPALDHALPVGVDDGFGGLFEYQIRQRGHCLSVVIHGRLLSLAG